MPTAFGDCEPTRPWSSAIRGEAALHAFPTLVLGSAARRAFESETAWKVLTVFRRSLYCASDGGDLACFGPLELGAGPLNVLAKLPKQPRWTDCGVYPGAAAGNDGTVFHLGPSLGISWKGAWVWQPPDPVRSSDPAALTRNLDRLAARVSQIAPGVGLAPLVPRLLDDAPLQAFRRKAGSALVLAALPAIAALQRWLASAMTSGSRVTVPASSVERLIGLGPGLTPSGDDCFIGTLVALRSLGWQRVADVLAAWLLPRARLRTHTISYAHLACAAKGEGAAALHDTVCALCSPDGAGPGALAALESIGHSSGWDALAGLALVTRLHATVLSAGGNDPA